MFSSRRTWASHYVTHPLIKASVLCQWFVLTTLSSQKRCYQFRLQKTFINFRSFERIAYFFQDSNGCKKYPIHYLSILAHLHPCARIHRSLKITPDFFNLKIENVTICCSCSNPNDSLLTRTYPPINHALIKSIIMLITRLPHRDR